MKTIRQLWDKYAAAIVTDAETPHEVSLQKTAYIFGVLDTIESLNRGQIVDPRDIDELLAEAIVNMHLDVDRRGRCHAVVSDN